VGFLTSYPNPISELTGIIQIDPRSILSVSNYAMSMPWSLKRYQEARCLHFLTFSCQHRDPLLGTPRSRDRFLQTLEKARHWYGFFVCGYVVMPEHVHLLINEPPLILVAQFLKALKQITSRELRGARRQFWQDRYFDSNIRHGSARSEVIRYIHRNPVKRGLAASPRAVPMEQLQPLCHRNSRSR